MAFNEKGLYFFVHCLSLKWPFYKLVVFLCALLLHSTFHVIRSGLKFSWPRPCRDHSKGNSPLSPESISHLFLATKLS